MSPFQARPATNGHTAKDRQAAFRGHRLPSGAAGF